MCDKNGDTVCRVYVKVRAHDQTVAVSAVVSQLTIYFQPCSAVLKLLKTRSVGGDTVNCWFKTVLHWGRLGGALSVFLRPFRWGGGGGGEQRDAVKCRFVTVFDFIDIFVCLHT